MTRNGDLQGFLFIGDPHLEGRTPDFRSDDFPNVILGKIQWCLDYAAKQNLIPVFLGDLFDKPRDNPTWMLGRLIDCLRGKRAVGIYGNHDCADPVLSENDSLTLLIKAGCLTRLSADQPWVGEIEGRPTMLGGSSYREPVPQRVNMPRPRNRTLFPAKPFGIWITHHDVEIAGYDGGRFAPFEIENIDVVVNGHIHTRSDPVQAGRTLWMTPGNITRRTRSEKSRRHTPAVLKITLNESEFDWEYVQVPHQPYDDVFHAPVFDSDAEEGASAFVAGLGELRNRKTSTGAGLQQFLKKNLDQFSEPVACAILSLAEEVTGEITLPD
jgi:hypothetical protein